MRGRSPLSVVVVALAVLATLSHVCAVPLDVEAHHEAHPEPMAPHTTPTETHDDGASCEALSPASAHAGLGPVPVATAVIAGAVLPAPASVSLAIRPVHSRSSPLFLLHLTLRI
jgi:hypothetical protein